MPGAGRMTGGWRRWVASTLFTLTVGLVAQTAAAHHGASSWGPFFRERYLVCSGELDHECIGLSKAGRASIVAALEAGTSGDLDTRSASRLHDAAAAAQLYAVPQARDPARRLLARTVVVADEDTWKATAIRRARVAGAMTLAALDDRASAPAILDLVRELETHGSGTLWHDALTALGQLDPAAAGDYAAEVLGRWQPKDMGWSMPGGTSREEILPFVEAHPTPKALAELRRLSPDPVPASSGRGASCRMRRTRIRIGDAPLEKEVRKRFDEGASGTWVAGCEEQMVRAFGTQPRDVDILLSRIGGRPRPDRAHSGMDYGVTNIAYGRVLELLVAMQDMPAGETRAARSKILRELTEHESYPYVATPGHEDYSTHFVAFNRAARAGAGSREAQAKLYDLIEDPSAADGAPWLAAYWALRLGLPGAEDAVAERLALGRHSSARWRGSVFDDIRVRTLDAFVARYATDSRWTVALLDGDIATRERALYHLARKKTLGACDAVFDHALDADTRAVQDAMVSLTALGTHCKPRFERAIRDAAAPSKIRGMAFEMLAVMGSPLPTELADEAMSQTGMKIYIDRARTIGQTLHPKPAPRTYPTKRTKSRRTRPLRRRRPRR